MADPLLIGALITTGVSTLLGAKASYDSGKAEKAAYDFNAAIARRNAEAGPKQAEVIKHEAELQIEEIKNAFQQVVGLQERSLAFNGWDADSGTGLELQLDAARKAEQDIVDTQYNAAVLQSQALEDSVQQELQSQLQSLYGGQAKTAGKYKAGTTLLSGIQEGLKIGAMM
ncbi:MAG: hypothetical protein VW270_21100 [Candidatus Poseidoniales archaeon]